MPDRASGTRRTVFETPDVSVSDYTLSQDGRTIYFTASKNGTSRFSPGLSVRW